MSGFWIFEIAMVAFVVGGGIAQYVWESFKSLDKGG